MKNHYDTICLGGGVTGLALGASLPIPVFEARDYPGGICASYYQQSQDTLALRARPADDSGYRFEIGGGHWLFGDNAESTALLKTLVPMRRYHRRASIYLGDEHPLIPYPLQHHLSHLGEDLAGRIVTEIEAARVRDPETVAEWVQQRFGPTLSAMFFGPFHELYTAGLWTSIAPQDGYKSPLELDKVRAGAVGHSAPSGYNVTFLYPKQGLDTLCRRLADSCDIRYEHEVIGIDAQEKLLAFSNGVEVHYDRLLSTLPLISMLELTGLNVPLRPDPFNSVLVLNIGAARGPNLPDDHWIYFPRSASGYHRVGIYSNVDRSFLPRARRTGPPHCALYVERSFLKEHRPGEKDLQAYVSSVVEELQALGYIKEVEVCDPTWIPVAYTWTRRGSRWAEVAQDTLRKRNICMAGRYGRWHFQGIADSVAEGLRLGAELASEQS